ncbi:MAG: sugar phosphate nucleotidyltransferase, partial [Verrucomicrobiae bacterium]|nr:sugar phosphate nucleotidyltransferase [Verrucomicrobiae bacterium]
MKPDEKLTNRYVVILAGGRGERFWPMSREKRPKQLLKLFGEQSFLQETVERMRPLVPLENLFVITNREQVNAVRGQLPEVPRSNIIAEPCGRDTCAAVVLGAAIVGARCPAATMAFLPADHMISELKKFRRVLADCYAVAERGQTIVTIGIKPTEPATVYGYIRVGSALPSPAGGKKLNTHFYKAERFVEKPDAERAAQYVASGEYWWNAGMFVFSFVTITESLSTHQPEMAALCRRWFELAGSSKLSRALEEDYPKLRKISIDYALMERAQNVVVAAGEFAWDDMGSWTALYRHLPCDQSGNCMRGDVVQLDAARNLVFDARTKGTGVVAILGICDSIIVNTDDAVLIAHRNSVHRLKEPVSYTHL